MLKLSKLLVLPLLAGATVYGQTCPSNQYFLTGSPTTLGTRNFFPYEGGTTRFAIETPPGCPWQATNAPLWVSVIGRTSGTGTTIIEIGVETNLTTTAREGFVVVSGLRFPVNQAAAPAGGCAFTLQSLNATAPANGAINQNGVNGTATCRWAGFANRYWLQPYPVGGQGSTAFSYQVFPNFSTGQRTGTVNMAAQRLVVLQQAATGSYTERFVRLLYFNFLGRLPRTDEVAFHVNNLQGGQNPAELVDAFMNTPEFNLLGRPVAGP